MRARRLVRLVILHYTVVRFNTQPMFIESDAEVYGGVPESGYANGQSYLGLPAAVSLLGQGFNVSTRTLFTFLNLPAKTQPVLITGGIQAATLNDTRVGSWFIPATAQSMDALPSGISDSYSMIQQGELTHAYATK